MVEEIVQDVFVTLWNKASSLDAAGNVAAWLFGTLRYKILYAFRQESIRQRYLKKAVQMQQISIESHAEEIIDLKQAKEKVMLSIQHLPPQCMEAFQLSRFEQLSYREIALRMGVSVKMVEKHISKALAVLRTELSELELPIILLLLYVFN